MNHPSVSRSRKIAIDRRRRSSATSHSSRSQDSLLGPHLRPDALAPLCSRVSRTGRGLTSTCPAARLSTGAAPPACLTPRRLGHGRRRPPPTSSRRPPRAGGMDNRAAGKAAAIGRDAHRATVLGDHARRHRLAAAAQRRRPAIAELAEPAAFCTATRRSRVSCGLGVDCSSCSIANGFIANAPGRYESTVAGGADAVLAHQRAEPREQRRELLGRRMRAREQRVLQHAARRRIDRRP